MVIDGNDRSGQRCAVVVVYVTVATRFTNLLLHSRIPSMGAADPPNPFQLNRWLR